MQLTCFSRHVVEVQLLLRKYLELKKFQHVLYEVERGDCFSPQSRIGVGVFRALDAHYDSEGLTTLVNAVDSSYRKIYARHKRETDAKIAQASAGFGAGTRIMELLEMEKQREKLVPLQEERERVQATTEVLVIHCLKAPQTP